MSRDRSKVALVDEHSRLLVVDVATETVLFQDDNAVSVAWNTECDGACYSVIWIVILL